MTEICGMVSEGIGSVYEHFCIELVLIWYFSVNVWGTSLERL